MKVKLTPVEAEFVRNAWEGYDRAGHPEWKDQDVKDSRGMSVFLYPVFASEGLTHGEAEQRAKQIKENGWEF